jgi:hypothetical protein
MSVLVFCGYYLEIFNNFIGEFLLCFVNLVSENNGEHVMDLEPQLTCCLNSYHILVLVSGLHD